MSKVVIDAIIQSSYLSYALALTICHTVTEILELIPPKEVLFTVTYANSIASSITKLGTAYSLTFAA